MDSGIGHTQDVYGPAHAQLVGRKRRADDDSLLIPSAKALENEDKIPWDAPHKRILFESEGPDSTSSEGGMQEARPGCPPDNVYPDSTQYGQLARERDHEELRLPGFTLEQRVLKLQKDLEEAKAESRYELTGRLPRWGPRADCGLPRHQYLGMQEGPIGINTVKYSRW